MKQILILKYFLRDFIKQYFIFEVYFFKPKKNKILVYDRRSESYAKLLFPKKDLSFFDTRLESINLYLIVFTLFRNGINHFKSNYKKNYFKAVQPKIVYTSIDNNLGFYKLKKECYKEAIFIADQNGMRDGNFCFNAKNFLEKNSYSSLDIDIFFAFGQNEKYKIKNVINMNKIFTYGSTKNNFYVNKKKKNIIKNLVFISSVPIIKFKRDLILFKKSLHFCKKFNYKLFFIDRLKKSFLPYLEQELNHKDFTYIAPQDSSSTYKFFNEENLLIFNHSTLGYEYMSRGLKSACFGHNHENSDHGSQNNYKKEGLFWTNKIDYKTFEKKILTIINYNPTKWKKDMLKYSFEIMYYDKFNKNKKKTINRILSKNL